MSNEITNDMDVIDSRDIIERIEELEALISNNEDDQNDVEEFESLTKLQVEGELYSEDWQYGSTLIHEDYFEQYMDEMVDDCYSDVLDTANLPFWMNVTYDYDALKMDYTAIDFNGETYYIR